MVVIKGRAEFDGKRYKFLSSHRTKGKARATAGIIRSNGHRARVIKVRSFRGTTWFSVFWRRGRRD